MEGRSLLSLDIGLPVEKLADPVRGFLTGRQEEDERVIELDAVYGRVRSIVVRITNTLRRGTEEEVDGLVLMMRCVDEESRRGAVPTTARSRH